MKNIYVSFVIIAIVIGGGAFYGGIKYQEGHTSIQPSQDSGNGSGNRRGGSGGQNNRAGFVNGEILSKDDKSLTLSLRDGGSKLVFYSNTTQVKKLGDASLDEIQIGKQVSVMGDANSDGSITAQTIQIRPTTGTQTMKMESTNSTFHVTGGSFYFTPNIIHVKKGDKVKIIFTNAGGHHDFTLDEFKVKIGANNAGETGEAEFVADKTGSFEYYCSVGSHRQMGQKGQLIVE